MKLYVLAEPNGLVQKLHVYGGSGDKEVGGVDHTAKVVHKLLEGKKGVGHSVYMDNFYNSVPLANALLDENTYCTGTLCSKRKGNPEEVLTQKLKRGESISRFNEKGVCVCKWRDKKDVVCDQISQMRNP